jgi:adenylate kinase family enzyme
MNSRDFFEHILGENFSHNLFEGVDDPGAFKAVILLGGPGSGKSYAASQLFGIPKNMTVSAGGLKTVNSDVPFEFLLKKNNIDMDLSKLTGDQREKVIGSQPDSLRSKAQRVRDFQFEKYSDAGTGVMLDSTGENLTSVRKRMQHLKEKGYDVTVVVIDTPLEVAQQRNQARDRKLPADMVEKIHSVVQKNVQEFKQELEGSDVEFVTVENGDGADINQVMQTQIGRVLRRAVSAPIKNPEGRRRIVQRRGGAVTKSTQHKLGRTRRGAGSSERQKAKYKEILKMRIKNPKTGNTILVSSALGAPQDSQVYQVATRFVQQQLQRK